MAILHQLRILDGTSKLEIAVELDFLIIMMSGHFRSNSVDGLSGLVARFLAAFSILVLVYRKYFSIVYFQNCVGGNFLLEPS